MSDNKAEKTAGIRQLRPLGKSGLTVAPLAFGGNVFGWTVDEQTAFTLLDAFVDHGFNLIDTADTYSTWVAGNHGGESETIIGNWIKRSGKRDKIVLATKVGHEITPVMKGLKRSYILQAVEGSLRRLRTDYIDLYQSHRDDPDTPIEETLEAYGGLIKQGKVRAIGASNFKAERLAEALRLGKQHGLPSYSTLQPLYNLYDRHDYETELEAFCLKNDLGVINYYSLASGFLTGKYRSREDLSKSPRGRRTERYLTARGFRILEALDRVAKDTHTSPAQVSLAWLLARPSITAPIASATSLSQLHELIAGTELKLDRPSIEALNEASS
jgi:aryl-alcohol dehydrogenase-like predicted oxidoreductase